jgi:hypothetical protein
MISRPCGDRPSVSIVCSIAFNNEIPNVQDTYPPYEIVRTGEETYRISLALAGFTPRRSPSRRSRTG